MDGKAPVYTKRDISHLTLTPSWRKYQEKLLYEDFKRQVVQCAERLLRDEDARNYPTQHYEFPNGFHVDFGFKRYKIGEFLFDPRKTGLPQADSRFGISSLMRQAGQMCDADVRNSLYNNIMVTGGGSLTAGIVERINAEVQMHIGGRTKLIQPTTHPMMNERRFSSWIGGSILASLGSFHHMWISKEEWDQCGTAIFEKKCIL